MLPDDPGLALAFGARLRGYRAVLGLSQKELAERLGCSRKQVGRWEVGEMCPPRARLSHLEMALDLSPGTLSDLMGSLDDQAWGGRMRRVRGLIEEGFAANAMDAEELAARAVGDATPPAGQLDVGRLSGPAEVVEAMIQLAIASSRNPPAEGVVATLVSGKYVDRSIDRSQARARWKRALQAMLASGWPIRHLWCGTALPPFEEWIVDFLGFKGRYELNRVGRRGRIPSYDVFDVPGVGSHVAFSTREASEVTAWASTKGHLAGMAHDAGLHAWAGAQVEPSQIYQFEGLEEVVPGLTRAAIEHELHMAAAERVPGSGAKLLLMDGLTDASQPESVALRLRERAIAAAPASQARRIRDYFEARLQRINRLHELLQEDGLRAICSNEALDEFMEKGRWPVERSTLPPLEKPLRIAWISNAVELLQRYGSSPGAMETAGVPATLGGERGTGTFKLALVERSTRPMLKRARWATIGDTQLFFSVIGSGGPGAHGRSLDPDVVATFRGIFEDLWQVLPPTAYEPARVIDRLERLLRSHTRKRRGGPPASRGEGGAPDAG